MAIMVIEKGMLVQKLLVHIKIDITMEFAMVNQDDVENILHKFS